MQYIISERGRTCVLESPSWNENTDKCVTVVIMHNSGIWKIFVDVLLLLLCNLLTSDLSLSPVTIAEINETSFKTA